MVCLVVSSKAQGSPNCTQWRERESDQVQKKYYQVLRLTIIYIHNEDKEFVYKLQVQFAHHSLQFCKHTNKEKTMQAYQSFKRSSEATRSSKDISSQLFQQQSYALKLSIFAL